jgi:hypothetical protein
MAIKRPFKGLQKGILRVRAFKRLGLQKAFKGPLKGPEGL